MYPQTPNQSGPRRDIVDRTFRFGVEVIRFSELLGRKAGARRMVANQLLRAGTSVGANVEEAQGGQGRKDFVAKMSIALKEAREARYWLRTILAADLHTSSPLPELIQEATEPCNILAAIIVSARRNDHSRSS